MQIHKYLIILLLLIVISCDEETGTEGIEGSIICDKSDLAVNESDKILDFNSLEPVLWEGTYNEKSVRISFTKKLNNHGVSETLYFVFNKVDNCLQIDRGYEFYSGGTADVSAITEVNVLELYVQDWIIDEKLTGKVVYRDHHDKLIKEYNFWVEFSVDNYEIESTNYTYFPNCFKEKLPKDIDIDKDGVTDYTLLIDETNDIGNRPNFTSYTIRLKSQDESINEILSPRGTSIPFPVIFEPPFSSENTRSYAANKFNSADVKNALDVFYEFEPPYENYNFFLQNNLTYKKEFNNNLDDYYLVKLIRNDEEFYGWIKVDFSALDCEVEVIDFYLNPTANEHVFVN